MTLTRRQLIARGVLASGALAIGGISVRYGSLFFGSPKAGLEVLTEKEHAILLAVLDTLFPKGAEMPPADPDFIVPRLDHWLAHTDPDARLLFRAMLSAIEDHALVVRLTRFTKLSPELRAEELRAWETTPIYLKKMAFASVKLFTGMQYFEQRDVRRELGWYLGCAPAHLDREGGAV